MCLSIAVDRPADVLAAGTHAGHEWMIVHNGMGYRCGYVKVTPGHPWHGLGYSDIEAEVHGGLTFAEPDKPCGKGGADDGWWLGFDCAHGGLDAPDPELPGSHSRYVDTELILAWLRNRETVKDTAYVQAECRLLCEQAAKAGELPA